MVYDTILLIDSKKNKPKFTEAGPQSAPPTSRIKMSVTFGFMPSYTSIEDGLGVDGVRSEGPAGRGGLKKGDIIVSSAIEGYGIVQNDPVVGTVIGKAVGTKDDDDRGIVEVVVGRV